MSLHNFNPNNKSWAMYTHTLSSISGDDLTIKPNAGKNLILEVSGNNNVFFKKGGVSHDLTNLSGGIISIASGLDASFSNLDINGNLNPLVANSSSIGLDNKNWISAYINNIYCETINTQYVTQHYTQRFANSLWNIIGQDISFSNSILLAGISNNGRVVALTEPAYASNRGRLYVYEISFNGISYSWTPLGLSSEILVGLTTTGNFGGDGNSVIALSSDGRVVAVNDTLNDTSGTDTGQVRVFELSANVWRQRGQLINGKPIASYGLGYNIALSGNGNIIAASSLTRPSPRNGEVLVYEFSGNTNSWIKMGQDISGVGGANFSDLGFSMSLSLDGTTLAAGYRSSTPSQVNIYRFNSSTRTWSLPIPTNNVINGSAIDQYFGWNIKLSSDGNTIVIGGIGYGTSIGNTSNGIGSVSVFKYNGTSWSQLGQTLYGTAANDLFGQWVQISNDGTIISAGGAISFLRVYKLSSNTWTQIGQVLNGVANHALSGDGTTLFQVINKTGGNFSRVYGMNKTIDNTLMLNSNTLMISGELFTSGNLNPFTNNSSSLGSASKIWGNAYIRDLSVGSIEVSGNIVPLRRQDISSNFGSSLKRWNTLFANDLSINKINGQVYNANTFSVLTSVSSDIIPISNNTLKLGDVSNIWSNAYIRDISVSSIDVSLSLNPLNNNSSSLGLITRNWNNAYIRDLSVSSIDVSTNLTPLLANSSSLGLSTKLWGNAYIRDLSVSSIDVSSNLNPLLANGSSLGLPTKLWGTAYIRDLSVSSIDVSSNLNPLLANSGSLGLPTKLWGNAYIRDLSVSSIDVSTNLNPFITGAVSVTQGTGGTVTISGGFIIHSFTTTGTSTFVPTFNGPVEVLIVGGGGGGGPNLGGGGGGGGVIWIPATNVISGTSYSVVVGAGGASGTSGIASSVFGATAAGGGSSGSWPSGSGTAGGSGGGAPANDGAINQGGASSGNSLGTNNGIANVGTIYGNRGGHMTTGRTGGPTRAAGGGGAGGQGLDTNSNTTGDTGRTGMGSGGVGVINAILGPSHYWAGGGGGAAWDSQVGGYGGLGGGGGGCGNSGGGSGGGSALNSGANGALGANTTGGAGGANTGGGGGGGNHSSGLGGTGGSGIVVIRYSQSVAGSANTSSLGLSTRPWGNAYISDLSVGSIDVSSNLTPLLANTLSLGLPTRPWNNAYIRDLSVISLDVSSNINPLITNNSILGSSLSRWNRLFAGDLSVNTINGQAYTSGGTSINLSSISGNIIPSLTNSFNLGSTTNYWNNGYIRNVITSTRAYQGISGDISGGNFGDLSWSAVNGYYGLAKDAYPGLNPLSSGDLAVSSWTARAVPEANGWHSVCWSPQLRLFVAVAYNGTNRVMISVNGINWIARPAAEANEWISVCWSPELRLFASVGVSGTNRVMTSPDGLTWTARTASELEQWISICWSSELGLFVAVGQTGNNRVMTSVNGITWTARTAGQLNSWKSVCWSPQLGLFVAVAPDGVNRVMSSSNGINWISSTAAQANQWYGVCWSAELGLFVAVSIDGTNRVMTSSNGITWSSTNISGVEANSWYSVCWSPQLELFIAVAYTGTNRVMTSPDGRNWTVRRAPEANTWRIICWSPELGIAVAVSQDGSNRVMTSSLRGRPPTSYNLFDSSFNRIDENGRWDFVNITTTTLTVNGATVTSDDRLKHNEVNITNGLTIIDQLVPKFYQKTLTMFDASYNGDLNGYIWNYETGLIAQELLQVPDLSFVVSGGDYYETVMYNNVSYPVNSLSYNEQKMISDLNFATTYNQQKFNNDLSFTISYYQQKMNLASTFDISYNLEQIINDLSYDISYYEQKMNNELNFYISYNEQKINYDLSFELSYYQQQQSINDLSQTNYYEVSKNLIKQVYALNYNSIFIYGLAAIKELHTKVKAQELTLLEQQATINSLAARLQALEQNNI